MRFTALLVLCLVSSFPAFAAEKESAYDRVMKTQTIRCGYSNRPPLFQKNIEDGQFSGLFKEYTESIAKALNLKIEWTEEIGWGEIVTALESGRIDVFCAGMWANATRVSRMDFIKPVAYEPMYVYVRADDRRFDADAALINHPQVKIIALEGASPLVVAVKEFPQATIMEMPQLTPISDLFVSLAAKKADVTLSDLSSASDFVKNNPNSIKRLASDKPVRAFGVSLGVAGGEYRLKRMLDLATEEFLQTREFEDMLARHQREKGALLPPAEDYRRP